MLLMLVWSFTTAQTQAEKDLLKTAEKQFESQEFLQALPSYRQLVSISPRNKEYNFKYGTCLLFSDEDVSTAVDHLSFACKGSSIQDKRAYFYLGKAYHLNYQFADALDSYREFKEKVDSKTGNSFREVDRLITMAENGKQLLSDIKDIKVLDKTESTVGDFFRNYDLSDMGGSVIKVPEELLTSTDKKKGHSPLMYFPQEGGSEIIYSSYGKGDHLDLYSVRRTSSGGFTVPEKLQGVVNSPFDEDFPFLHADGRTLYFSSKGHNSMGGYDIFRSERNLSTGVFESPENLDFAISTPDDDIFYVVDKDKRIAHFASTRSSEQGRLHVYQVAVSAAPLELAIVKGALANTKGGSIDAQIKVIDATTNEELGAYRTDKYGNYLIDLPGAGKYKFYIDVEDSQITHTGLVDVPSFGRMRAFEQDMELLDVSSQEKLVIKNHFDKEPSEDVMSLAQQILKDKARLDVNFEGEVAAAEEIEEELSAEDILIRSGYEQGTTMESVLETAYQQEAKVSERIEIESRERDQAFARATEMSTLAEQSMAEADELYRSVQTENDPSRKEELMLNTAIKRAEAMQYAREAEIALGLAEELADITRENEETRATFNERNTAIEQAIQAGDSEEATSLITQVKASEDHSLSDVDALDTSTKKSLQLTRESQQTLTRLEKIRNDRDRVAASVKTKENVLSRTAKKKDIEILEAELTALNSELEDLDSQLERNKVQLDKTQHESEVASGSVILLEKMRLGQEPELMAIQPLSIPAGGLKGLDTKLEAVKEIGGNISLSDEEITQILARRPALLASYSGQEKELLARSMDFEDVASMTESTASLSESSTKVETPDIEESTSDLDEGYSDLVEDTADNSAQETASLTETSTEAATELATDSDVQQSEGVTENEQVIDDSADLTQLSLDELLAELQAEYPSEREEIELSDSDPVTKAQAKIDLNKNTVQQIEQKILTTRYSDGYAEDAVKQGNVSAMEDLVEHLKEEMLTIAKESEEYQDIAESDPLPFNLDANELQAVSQTSGMSEQLDDHYSKLASINSDTSTTSIVQLSSRMKEHFGFQQDIQAEIEKLRSTEAGDTAEQDKLEALETLFAKKDAEIAADISTWESDTGIELSAEEKVLAGNSSTYITERSLVQAQGNEASIDILNGETAQKLLDSSEQTAIDLNETERQALLSFESTTSVSGIDSAPNAEAQEATIQSAFGLQALGASKDWANELFDNKRSKSEGLAMQKELSAVQWQDLSPEELMAKEIDVAMRLRSPINEELLYKEDVLAFTSKNGEGYEEVAQLITQAYGMDRAATSLRSQSSELGQAEKHDRLNKALLLELAAVDKMNEALALEKHLSKGRPMADFTFQDAVVIDEGLLENEEVLALLAEQEGFSSAGTEELAESGESDRSPVGTVAESEIESQAPSTSEEFSDTIDQSTETIEDTSDEVELAQETDAAGQETIESEPISEETDTLDEELGSVNSENSEEELVDISTSAVEEDLVEQEDNSAIGSEELEEEMVESMGSSEDEVSTEVSTSTDMDLAERAEIPADELAKAQVIDSTDEIDDIELLSSAEAIQTFPRTSSELTSQNILPVLTYKEEMQMRDAIVENYSFTSDSRASGLTAEEIAVMEAREVDMAKSQAYQAELHQVVQDYQGQITERKVQLAEVVDIINTDGETPERTEKRARLTAEIQVINSYLDQAQENQLEVSKEIGSLVLAQEASLEAAADRESASLVEDEVEEVTVEEVPEVVELEEEIIPEEPSTPTPVYDEFGIPDVLVEDIFSVNDNTPRQGEIPMNVALPSGVIYQVQVGAFRNPIPQDHFAEFDPIMGEKLNSDITRYKVGLFLDRESATSARDQIRGLGYSDAFVVRYVDGQRGGAASEQLAVQSDAPSNSSTAQEQGQSNDPVGSDELSDGGTVNSSDEVDTDASTSSDSASGSSGTSTSAVPDAANPTAYYESFESAAPATQVEIVDGLFYTVQVGVYSKPVTSSSIYDITPLNSELLSNGLIKYTSGIFDEVSVADQWKESIRSKGVTDAFVTAYYNGERVTLSRAAIIRADKGESVMADLDEMDALHTDRQGQAVWEMVSTSELFSEEVEEQIEFKIRMGPYLDRIPDKDVKVILDFEDNVDYGRREDGAIIYTTKGSMTYEEAQKWRTTFLESGITNANIIALQNGNEISVKQALDFLLK
jgi:hypothetical protein